MQVKFVTKGFGPAFDVTEGWGVGAVFPFAEHGTVHAEGCGKEALGLPKFLTDGAEFADEWGGEQDGLDPSIGFGFGK
jgi:hypothetical protein